MRSPRSRVRSSAGKQNPFASRFSLSGHQRRKTAFIYLPWRFFFYLLPSIFLFSRPALKLHLKAFFLLFLNGARYFSPSGTQLSPRRCSCAAPARLRSFPASSVVSCINQSALVCLARPNWSLMIANQPLAGLLFTSCSSFQVLRERTCEECGGR